MPLSCCGGAKAQVGLHSKGTSGGLRVKLRVISSFFSIFWSFFWGMTISVLDLEKWPQGSEIGLEHLSFSLFIIIIIIIIIIITIGIGYSTADFVAGGRWNKSASIWLSLSAFVVSLWVLPSFALLPSYFFWFQQLARYLIEVIQSPLKQRCHWFCF